MLDYDDADAATYKKFGLSVTKKEAAKIKRIIEKRASLLPDLPDSASKLSVELHERAQAMLKVRMESIEVSINQRIDEALDAIVKEELGASFRSLVVNYARKRIEEVIPSVVDRLFPEVVGSATNTENLKYDLKNQVDRSIRARFEELAKGVAQTEAENLIKAALDEIRKYYGAANMLAADGGDK